MAKSKKRIKLVSLRKRGMGIPGQLSRYAKKIAYLKTHDGWGFDYPEPKPWK